MLLFSRYLLHTTMNIFHYGTIMHLNKTACILIFIMSMCHTIGIRINLFRCFQSPMHELIHCLQSLAKLDFDPTSWKSEHGTPFVHLSNIVDASRVETNLLVAVINRINEMSSKSPSSVPPVLQPLTESLLEEILLYNLGLLSKHMLNSNTDSLEGYRTWRDSFGRKSPQEGKDAWFAENADLCDA